MKQRVRLHPLLFVSTVALNGCAEVNHRIAQIRYAAAHADDPRQLGPLVLGCFVLIFIVSLIFGETNSVARDLANAVRYTSVGALVVTPFYWWYTHNLGATIVLGLTGIIGACVYDKLK